MSVPGGSGGIHYKPGFPLTRLSCDSFASNLQRINMDRYRDSYLTDSICFFCNIDLVSLYELSMFFMFYLSLCYQWTLKSKCFRVPPGCSKDPLCLQRLLFVAKELFSDYCTETLLNWHEYQILTEILTSDLFYIIFYFCFIFKKYRQWLEECPHLSAMEKLQVLNLQHNLITRIQHLSHLQQLVFLNLHDNHLSEMIGIEDLTSLRILMLGKNRLVNMSDLSELLL